MGKNGKKRIGKNGDRFCAVGVRAGVLGAFLEKRVWNVSNS